MGPLLRSERGANTMSGIQIMSQRRPRRLRTDRRAATAVLFAIGALPIVGMMALAVDVGSAVWARGKLALAADSAALAAVMAGANAFAQNPNASLQPAQLAGTQRYAAQAGAIPSVVLGATSVSVTRTGGTIAATVTYSASYTTHFAKVLGFTRIALGGTTSTTRTNSPYFDIEIAMDNSSSMAIAATQAGMAQLGALVQRSPLYGAWGQGQPCAFGCHFDSGSNDFYGLAHAGGVELRIDVLLGAVQGMLQTLARSTAAAQFQVGLYTFMKTLTTVFPSSNNIAAAEQAAAAVTVPVTTNGGDANTNFPAALGSLTTLLPVSGDGSVPSSPRRFVFIVTDGVADYMNGSTRVMAPFDPAWCSGLKAKGIQVLTLYTQYYPIPINAFYNSNIAPFVGQVAPNLAACASSPAFAFQATDAASIQAAMQAMVQAAINSPARLTQ